MLSLLFASFAFAGTHFVTLPAHAVHVRPADPPPAVVVVPSPGIRPPHAPPPPVVIAAPLPMHPERFQALLYAIDQEPFSDDQLDIIRSAAAYEHFTIAQLGAMMDQLAFSSDRVEAARLLRPRILDPQNAWMLNEHLVFSSDKEAVQRMYR